MTELQPSDAVATPVRLVVAVDGHSRTALVGQINVGGVVSRMVMVWTQRVLLPQASVAVQVSEMIFAPPHVLHTLSLYVTVTAQQPSTVVATPGSFVVCEAGHSSAS